MPDHEEARRRTPRGPRATRPSAARGEDEALSDEDVIARVLAGEQKLFEVVMRRHNQRLYRVIRCVLSDEDEAEDVMQFAYVAAFANLRQFAGRARFSTWLCRIGLNQALLRARRQRREQPLPDSDGESAMAIDRSAPEAQSPESRVVARQLQRLLEGAIDELPHAYRLVFVMREAEELSTSETAELLSLTEEAVKVRLHRARARIRESLHARVGAASAAEVFSFYRPRCDRVVAAVFARIAAGEVAR